MTYSVSVSQFDENRQYTLRVAGINNAGTGPFTLYPFMTGERSKYASLTHDGLAIGWAEYCIALKYIATTKLLLLYWEVSPQPQILNPPPWALVKF